MVYSKDLFKEYCNGANILYFCHIKNYNDKEYKFWFSNLRDAKKCANVFLKANKVPIIYIRQYHIDDVVGEYIKDLVDIKMHSFLKHYNIKGDVGYGC